MNGEKDSLFRRVKEVSLRWYGVRGVVWVRLGEWCGKGDVRVGVCAVRVGVVCKSGMIT